MFKTADKTELNQISLTGTRALVFIGLLIKGPHSLEEIKRTFVDLQIMEDSHSDDIVRIDLNTIKTMGCVIDRCSAKTNFKYVLKKHPFAFKVSKDEIKNLKKVYNIVKQDASFEQLLEYHDMFDRIAKYICDEESKEAILGISIFKYYDVQEIKDLITDCERRVVLDLFYKKPNSLNASRKRIVAQQLVYKNDKIYIYGYDLDKKDSIVLNYSRIESIISKSFRHQEFEEKSTRVRFALKNFDIKYLESDERVVNNENGIYTVEGLIIIISWQFRECFLLVLNVLSWSLLKLKTVLLTELKK